MVSTSRIWISRDYSRCSGCRRCEIACSLHHEGRIWPEASRVRVFMLVPGAEVPHLCAQCDDYPCVNSCTYNALSIDDKTGAVLVDKEKCTACGACINACPGRIPHLHPREDYILICDLCGGDPQCVRVCQEGKWDALRMVKEMPLDWQSSTTRLYARTPEEITRDLVKILYGEASEEVI